MTRAVDQVRDEIRLRQHHALRLTRRARRINDRRQIIGPQFTPDLIEQARLLPRERAPARFNVCERERACVLRARWLEEDDVFECGARLDRFGDAIISGAVADKEQARARIVEDVTHLRRSLRRIDGHVHQARHLTARIRQHPFGATLGQKRRTVAAAQAQRIKTERDVACARDQFDGRDRVPHAVAFVVERVRLVVYACGLEIDFGERRRLVGRQRRARRRGRRRVIGRFGGHTGRR